MTRVEFIRSKLAEYEMDKEMNTEMSELITATDNILSDFTNELIVPMVGIFCLEEGEETEQPETDIEKWVAEKVEEFFDIASEDSEERESTEDYVLTIVCDYSHVIAEHLIQLE